MCLDYAGSKFVFNPFDQVLFSVSTFNDDNVGSIAPSSSTTFNDDNVLGKNAGSIVPGLPPSYPGTIIGGTGLFVGAVGFVDVTTITGSTLTPVFNVDDENIRSRYPQAGYITQKINVVTNVPLPVAP